MSSVTLKQINKTYPGGIEAVKSLDLDIEDKEFVVLVGPVVTPIGRGPAC